MAPKIKDDSKLPYFGLEFETVRVTFRTGSIGDQDM